MLMHMADSEKIDYRKEPGTIICRWMSQRDRGWGVGVGEGLLLLLTDLKTFSGVSFSEDKYINL